MAEMPIQQHQEDPTQHHHFPTRKMPHHQHRQPQPQPQQMQYMDKNTLPRFRPNPPKRQHCICITVFLLLLGIILLILWLAYHPSKPRFAVASAAVYGLNVTSVPPLVSAAMQFNVLIRNPNRRVSIYFDRLYAYVSYREQPITPRVVLPPLFLEKHATVSLSPEIGGATVPATVEMVSELGMDQNYGVVGVKLVFVGRLRWKSGDINSAHYGLYVKCDILMALRKGLIGQIPLLGAPLCDVHT
ncbi:hypothetical protein RJT34_15739 [Clitoria ternatea]|uniref:Late embryogenesis abundant protein LEA-2 subgroup domain-containing protein n=1 Tax=Clitoria ternatea TaxID=43366 RepID=A0AAN9J8Z1_CLITE